MTRTLVVLCALDVGACDESAAPTGQDLAACRLEAIKVYPHWRNHEDVIEDQGVFTEFCMKAKGYEMFCRTTGSGVEWVNQTMESCYRKAKAS